MRTIYLLFAVTCLFVLHVCKRHPPGNCQLKIGRVVKKDNSLDSAQYTCPNVMCNVGKGQKCNLFIQYSLLFFQQTSKDSPANAERDYKDHKKENRWRESGSNDTMLSKWEEAGCFCGDLNEEL